MIRRTLVGINTPRGGSVPDLDEFMPFTWKDPALSDIDRALIDWAKKLGATNDPGGA